MLDSNQPHIRAWSAGDGQLVLTNSHVVHAGDGSDGPLCDVLVGLTESFADAPAEWLPAVVVADETQRDLAVLRLAEQPGAAHRPLAVAPSQLSLGDEITILGYPAFGQSQETLTFTSGRFSGWTTDADGGKFLKTDALLDSGVSGGAVFDSSGRLIGVATGAFEGEGGHLGLIIAGQDIIEFLRANGR